MFSVLDKYSPVPRTALLNMAFILHHEVCGGKIFFMNDSWTQSGNESVE